MDEVNDQKWFTIDDKLAIAEDWFKNIDYADPRFEKGFDRYCELLRDKAKQYIEQNRHVEQLKML